MNSYKQSHGWTGLGGDLAVTGGGGRSVSVFYPALATALLAQIC